MLSFPSTALREIWGAHEAQIRKIIAIVVVHRRLGVAAILVLLFTSLMQLPMPLVTRYLIDDVFGGRSRMSIYTVGVAILGIQILMYVAHYLSVALSARFRTRVLTDVEAALYAHACNLPYEYHLAQQPGYLMARISGDVNSLQGFLAEGIATFLQSFFSLVVGIAAIFLLEPRLAALCVASVPIYIVLIIVFSRRIKASSAIMQEEFGLAMGVMQEGISDNQILKLMNAEGYYAERARASIAKRANVGLDFLLLNARYGASTALLTGIVNAIMLVMGGVLVIRGGMTVGTLIAFTSYIGFVFNPIRTAATTIGGLQTSIVCLGRVCDVLAVESEADLNRGTREDVPGSDIRFRGVSYGYPGREGCLKEVSLHVRACERVAFVGASGSGKTTMVMLLAKILRGYTGQVAVGGVDLAEISTTVARRKVVVVPQSITLFSGTVRENLLIGRTGFKDEDIFAACRAASIDGFVRRLPEELDTSIGARGAKVSGGERQRIAIARALLGKPEVLVLDEATSDLDAVSEFEVNAAIRGITGCTVIAIVHRLCSTIDADRIYVFDDGRIVASGTHFELLNQCVQYEEMCRMQSIT